MCGCDRIALAPPSGWRCSTGTQSRSPETEQIETERDYRVVLGSVQVKIYHQHLWNITDY